MSQVQPDIFTSIDYLCIVVILMDCERMFTNIVLYCIFFISVATHMSHPLLITGTLVFLFLFRAYHIGKDDKRPAKKMMVLIILSLCGFLTMTKPLSRSRNIFFAGSLIQKGILKTYLHDKCGTKNYSLCRYADDLPDNADVFWWLPSSPLYQIGGWKNADSACGRIVYDVMTDPKYFGLYVVGTIKQAGSQAVTFSIGEGNTPMSPDANTYYAMQSFFPGEFGMFNNAWQNKADITKSLVLPNKALAVIILCSVIALRFIFIRWHSLSRNMKLVLFVCISGVIFNCLDCAAFGTISGRYGGKMIWLIPFCVLAWIATKSKVKSQNQKVG